MDHVTVVWANRPQNRSIIALYSATGDQYYEVGESGTQSVPSDLPHWEGSLQV